MRFFVTGGTGFVGGTLVRRLLAEGHEVVALARSEAKGAPLVQLGAECAVGDITVKDSMASAMEGVDGIFHVAGWYRVGVRDKRAAALVNVQGTRNVLELMAELETPRGVYTSTLAVFSDTHGAVMDESYRPEGPFLSVYDRTKWQAHYEVAEPLMQEGLPLTIVLPGMVYGPGLPGPLGPFWDQYFRGKLRFLPRRSAYCWGHVDDIADGHLRAMEKGKPGESYIIGGPPHTLVEAFDIAEEITGIPGPRRRVSPGFMRTLAAVSRIGGGLAFWSEADRAEMYRVGAGVTYLGRSAKAEGALGYRPRSLEAGLQDVLPGEMRRRGLLPP